MITEKFRPGRKPTVSYQSNRQRTIVVTFDTVADAEAWDDLDDATAIAVLSERSYACHRADHRG